MIRLGLVMLGLWLGWMAIQPEPEIVLVAIGDWGEDPIHPENRDQVLNAMASWCYHHSCDGIISTGDNFYPHGVSSIEDPLFQTFDQCFGRPGLSHLPFYVAVGNHDYEGPGNITAQIAYSQIDPRWIFPNRYYTRNLEGSDFILRLIVLDTMPMVPYYYRINSEQYYSQNRSSQLEWLQDVLRNTPSNMINLVVMHHPEVTPVAARHQDKPTELQAIFDQFKVPIVITGHIHNLQHIWLDSSPTQYAVTGSGSLIWNPPDIDSIHCNGCKWWIGYEFGFLSLRVSRHRIRLQFWSSQSILLREVNISV